jgi:HAD superfamily hydrolase (TIGR01549 family)
MAVAAIFDLDGTLVTFNLDIKEWRKVLFDVMKKRGFTTGTLTLSTPTQEILDYAKDQAGPDNPQAYQSLRSEAFSILDTLELEGAASATVFPDTTEVLRYFSTKGVRLGVLTNSGRRAASESLRKAGIGDYFEFVLTRDDTETMKPRPEGLIRAVTLLGVKPADAYYIGDSRYDVEAAKLAGVRSVAVATGNYSVASLKELEADFVITSLSQLKGVLGV